jgi:hypothetical protein
MAGELKTSVILELVDRITSPVRRVTQALAGISRRAALDNLKNSARGVQTALAGTLKQAMALGKGLAIVGGAAAAAGWTITRMVGGVATLGNEIKVSSERLGVGAGWLQEWFYVGQQFSVGNDALIDGFKELGLRADEFVKTGSGSASEAFERLGITVRICAVPLARPRSCSTWCSRAWARSRTMLPSSESSTSCSAAAVASRWLPC